MFFCLGFYGKIKHNAEWGGKRMETVVLYGSPHETGNTKIILDAFLDELPPGNVSFLDCYHLAVRPCVDCGYCRENELCKISDDMGKIYESLLSCDLVVVASPVYFNSFPAPLKAVVDRTNALYHRKYKRNLRPEKRKKGVFILTAGAAGKDVYQMVKAQTKHFFDGFDAVFEKTVFAPDLDENREFALKRASEEAAAAARELR
jgi:multimeric flavodoxin WrbA